MATVDELILRLTIQNDAADRASQRGRSAFAGLRVGITAAADASRRMVEVGIANGYYHYDASMTLGYCH